MSLRPRGFAFALTLFLCAAVARAQSIVTVAGGGSDDGQLGTNLFLHEPRGLAFDPDGNLHFVEHSTGQVRVLFSDGTVATVVGTGASGFSGDDGVSWNATLKEPRGIAFDGDANLYIADYGNGRVRKVDAETNIITTFGEFAGPWDVAVDRGFLYVTEAGFDGNRVRRINLATKAMETIAGPADVLEPRGIAVDAAGNVYVADGGNARIRTIDAASGAITTFAGGGTSDADGVLATEAALPDLAALEFDDNGNLYLTADLGFAGRVRRIDVQTKRITTIQGGFALPFALAYRGGNLFVTNEDSFLTNHKGGTIVRINPAGDLNVVAGGGSYIGDGLDATAAILHQPRGIEIDREGNVFIADSVNTVVRRIDVDDWIIRTAAGTLGEAYAPPEQEGQDAIGASIGFVVDVAVDSAGNLYTADPLNEKVWKIDRQGKITTYAQNVAPWGLAFDDADNLFLSDRVADVVRRVDAQTKAVTTVAGNGTEGYSGDGGPATAASLYEPVGVAVDSNRILYIADSLNGVVRRVATDGTITTFAGKPRSETIGDGGPATEAMLEPRHLAVHVPSGDLYITDGSTHRVRKVDATTRVITTVAGSGIVYFDTDFQGDFGRATDAKLNFGFDYAGIAVDADRSILIADTLNNRIRAVLACQPVAAPQLSGPADGSSLTTAPVLSWGPVDYAFRFDVRLDTVNPPQRVIAADVTELSFAPANLQPATRYYWQVVSKGDPFCPPVSTASEVRSFTTTGLCGVGSFNLTSPAEGESVTTLPARFTWQAADGAGGYDLYLGTVNPPPLFRADLRETSFETTLAAQGTHYWLVVARAACDDTKTATTAIRSFQVNVSQSCDAGATAIVLTRPSSGSTNVAGSVDLEWQTAGCASAPFELYFGTTTDPPLLTPALNDKRETVSGLAPSTTYYWRVIGRSAIDSAVRVASPLAAFTTAACSVPGTPTIAFAPASVSAGSTYTMVWTPATGVDANGGYLIERSRNASFASGVVAQVVSSTAASFVAEETGTYFHRVRAVPGCDPARAGVPSAVASVIATAARPTVVFTTQPEATITTLGERLENRRGSFALENLGTERLQVIIGRQEIGGSQPFFSIAEEGGGEGAFVTLEPRVPRKFEIRYSGPSNNVAASYNGIIFVASTGQGLSVTPYAFVNLKVGGGAAVPPQVFVDGSPVSHVFFPPFAGDDAVRPPIAIAIRNPGTTPMDLAAEIGPEVWLVPETGWNSTALAPGETRSVNLQTRRTRAPNGSALPRYTYMTLRTKDGASTRLLVQDNDAIPIGSGRGISLGAGDRSFIVPEASLVRLSNVGSESVQAELIFTPSGADGFDATVRRASVVVPPNDVVTLTDPLVQLFRLTRGVSGQIEIRVPAERQGLINATASVPVIDRGQGARLGAKHELYGVRREGASRTAVVLAETSGIDRAVVRLNGTITRELRRYGHARIDDVEGDRIEISVESGGGSVIGIGFVGTATTVSVPVSGIITGLFSVSNGINATTVVPIVGPRTALGLVGSGTFTAVFRDPLGRVQQTKEIPVPSGGAIQFRNVMQELFGVDALGSLFITSPSGSRIYATLQTSAGSPSTFMPLPTTLSEALTSVASYAQRPLFYDGLEQSIDATRGSRWMLLLNEVGGAGGAVNVRLYEPGNRGRPIAERDFTMGAYQQLKLDTVFAELGLDSADRRKDRTNVQVVVTARSGAARVAATVVSTDNASGDVKAFALAPSVGSATPNVTLVSPVLPPPTTAPTRRRSVRR
jgi:sugar lactone lactonase YvrE